MSRQETNELLVQQELLKRHLKVLGLKRKDAFNEQGELNGKAVAKAYREKALLFHPDKSSDPAATRKTQELNAAKDYLHSDNINRLTSELGVGWQTRSVRASSSMPRTWSAQSHAARAAAADFMREKTQPANAARNRTSTQTKQPVSPYFFTFSAEKIASLKAKYPGGCPQGLVVLLSTCKSAEELKEGIGYMQYWVSDEGNMMARYNRWLTSYIENAESYMTVDQREEIKAHLEQNPSVLLALVEIMKEQPGIDRMLGFCSPQEYLSRHLGIDPACFNAMSITGPEAKAKQVLVELFSDDDYWTNSGARSMPKGVMQMRNALAVSPDPLRDLQKIAQERTSKRHLLKVFGRHSRESGALYDVIKSATKLSDIADSLISKSGLLLEDGSLRSGGGGGGAENALEDGDPSSPKR